MMIWWQKWYEKRQQSKKILSYKQSGISMDQEIQGTKIPESINKRQEKVKTSIQWKSKSKRTRHSI